MLEGTWLTVQGWRCPAWAGLVSRDREGWLIADHVFSLLLSDSSVGADGRGKVFTQSVLSSALCQGFVLWVTSLLGLSQYNYSEADLAVLVLTCRCKSAQLAFFLRLFPSLRRPRTT